MRTSTNRVRDFLPSNLAQFESVFGPLFQHAGGVQAFHVPASVWEESGAYHVELDVPGVDREHVDITYDKGTLRITTERPAPEDQRTGLVDERRYGKVTRTVALPESIDVDSIGAELTNGVLHVTVAKKPEAQPKRIEIK